MARVVQTVASDYSDTVDWKIVVSKKLDGATRYAELSRKHGAPLPVPSIIINDTLAFESIPSVENLRSHIERRLEQSKLSQEKGD